MRTRRRFASRSSRAISQQPSTVLAAVVLLSSFAAPSWAGITSITWNYPYSSTAVHSIVVNQGADLVFHTDDFQFSGTAHIEARDANEAGLPSISLAALGLPDSIPVQGFTTTYHWIAPYIGQDDDNTPDRQEIVVRLRDVTPTVQSPVLEINLNSAGPCECEREPARIGLPGTDGAASPTAVTLRVLRESPLGSGISFVVGLPAESQARVDVFDITGRRLRTVSNGVMSRGETTLKWDGCDDAGRPARAGIVFARLSTPREVRSARLVVGPGTH